MLHTKSRPSLARKKSAQNRVYIPENNRENHYLLLEFELSEMVIAKFMNAGVEKENALARFYLDFKQNFFNCCKVNGIQNAMFVARDKLVRVRFGEESQVIETNEQLLVFYDPQRHSGFKSCYSADVLVSKLVLVVFATGDEIRQQAVSLHQKVSLMLTDLAEATGQQKRSFKIRDHQHITYDLFAAEKGNKKTTTHGLRFVPERYQQQSLILPSNTLHRGYVVAQLPIPMHLIEQAETNLSLDKPYKALYNSITRMLQQVAEENDVTKFAILANGRHPIVWASRTGQMIVEEELVYISFSNDDELEFMSDMDETNLIDSVSLVFQPVGHDVQHDSFAKYLSKINLVIKDMAKMMGVDTEQQHVMVRFHQNTQYRLPKTLD